MRIAGTPALVALALLAFAARLGAQQDSLGAMMGQRIRATFLDSPTNGKTRRVAGTLQRLDPDTLFLSGDRSAEVGIPRINIRRVDVSSGRRSRTGHGAALGALIGAGSGVAAGLVVCQVITSCDSSGGEFTGVAALVLGFGGALAGTGIGAIVGSFHHTDRWRPLRLSRRPDRPGVDGLDLGLSLRF